jgi:hypothetical protein
MAGLKMSKISDLLIEAASIDWLCPPRPVSPPVFARLLDPSRGHSFLSQSFEAISKIAALHGQPIRTTLDWCCCLPLTRWALTIDMHVVPVTLGKGGLNLLLQINDQCSGILLRKPLSKQFGIQSDPLLHRKQAELPHTQPSD